MCGVTTTTYHFCTKEDPVRDATPSDRAQGLRVSKCNDGDTWRSRQSTVSVGREAALAEYGSWETVMRDENEITASGWDVRLYLHRVPPSYISPAVAL
ncbi:hypothetical protein V496_04455 [Pseudogymnoascus sp. VKM F-4515 (FW-2607)]|nr:hypothetical protein V496_04455 [Pseudogymnoascus sp. VKM F-4515 (FW-2607)]